MYTLIHNSSNIQKYSYHLKRRIIIRTTAKQREYQKGISIGQVCNIPQSTTVHYRHLLQAFDHSSYCGTGKPQCYPFKFLLEQCFSSNSTDGRIVLQMLSQWPVKHQSSRNGKFGMSEIRATLLQHEVQSWKM